MSEHLGFNHLALGLGVFNLFPQPIRLPGHVMNHVRYVIKSTEKDQLSNGMLLWKRVKASLRVILWGLVMSLMIMVFYYAVVGHELLLPQSLIELSGACFVFAFFAYWAWKIAQFTNRLKGADLAFLSPILLVLAMRFYVNRLCCLL